MKRALHYIAAVFLAAFSAAPLHAQTVLSTTAAFTNNNGSGTVTFNLHNTNNYNIIITDIAGVTGTSGSVPVELYYNTTPVSAAPAAINAANGWILAASTTITGIANTTSSVTQPFLSNISLVIPANTTYGIVVYALGQRYNTISSATPITISAGGLDFLTGTNIGWGVGTPPAAPTFTPRGWIGTITFIPAVPCGGAPTAGTAVSNPGCPASVSLTGGTAGSATGLVIQWQQRPICTSNWVNIPGANGVKYNLPPQGSAIDYRAYVICNNSGLSDTSSIVTVTTVAPCYCPSVTTSNLNDDIYDVSVGTWNNQSTCASVAPGPGSVQNAYSNYTTLPPIRLLKGTSYPFSAVSGNCGTSALSYGVAVFIDLNRNGTFDVPSELVYGSGLVASPVAVSGTISIPAGASSGVTGMRVVLGYNTAGTSILPCTAYTYGETEDYLVDIQYAPDVTGGGVYCSGESVVLAASAPGVTNPRYLWKLPGTPATFDTVSTINLSPAQVSQSGNYVIYLLVPSCNGNIPDTIGGRVVPVTINQTPPKPSAASLIVYCQNDPFDSIAVFGQDLKWYTVPANGTPNTGPPIVNTSQIGTSTHYVSQTINGCESQRAIVTINVVPKPVPPQVITPVRYCQGDAPFPLQAWGQNIRWYSVLTGGVGTSIVPTPTTNAQGTFTWYVTQTVAGCESNRTPVTVTVNYIPNALIKASSTFVCQYKTISLSYFGNATTTADYIWTMPTGAYIESGSGQGPLVVRFDSAGMHRIKLTVDNGGCVGPEATIDIEVRQSPRFALEMQPDVCKGELVNVAVSYSTTGIDSYNWNGFDGAEVVYGALPKGPFGIRWNTPGQKIITVVATDDICESKPMKDTIMVHDLPDAHITVTSSSICSGDSVEFSAPFETGNTYQWLPFQFFDQSNSSVKWGTVDYTRSVVLNVTNSYNCRATDSVLITAKPCCQVYFPNAFSPNGDGKNDFFKVISSGHHEITSLRVQNRWGQTVFETADERQGWDGTLNGKPQDVGTYFYYIKYKCSDNKFYEDKGELMLVR